MKLRGRRFELVTSGIAGLAWAVMILSFLVAKLFLEPGDAGRSTIASVMVSLVVLCQLPALGLVVSGISRSVGAASWLPGLVGCAVRVGACLWLASFLRVVASQGR